LSIVNSHDHNSCSMGNILKVTPEPDVDLTLREKEPWFILIWSKSNLSLSQELNKLGLCDTHDLIVVFDVFSCSEKLVSDNGVTKGWVYKLLLVWSPVQNWSLLFYTSTIVPVMIQIITKLISLLRTEKGESRGKGGLLLRINIMGFLPLDLYSARDIYHTYVIWQHLRFDFPWNLS
jgi:hypothetical protein